MGCGETRDYSTEHSTASADWGPRKARRHRAESTVMEMGHLGEPGKDLADSSLGSAEGQILSLGFFPVPDLELHTDGAGMSGCLTAQ